MLKKYFFTIFLVATESFSQDLFLNQTAVPQKHFASVVSSNKISEYPVLIPDEPWKFMFSGVYQTTGTGSGLPFGEVYGVKFSDNNLIQYSIDLQANLAQRSDIGDWSDEPCKGSNHLWMNSVGGKFKDINCATINFNSEYINHNAAIFLTVYGKARGINYSIPTTTIEVLFVRHSDRGRRLQYKVNINPVFYGFNDENESNKNINRWGKQFYFKDDAKRRFVEDLSLWAHDVQKRMNKAFNGNITAFLDVPKYSDYLNKNYLNKPIKPNMEDRLSLLKELFAKNLITEKQYDDQVKIILLGN